MIIGQTIFSTVTFTDRHGSLTDPSTVKAFLRTPDGEVEEFVFGVGTKIERLSDGVYEIAITAESVGSHRLRWEGSGDVVSVTEVGWRVHPSRVIANA